MVDRLFDSDVYTGRGAPETNVNPDKKGSIYIDYETGNRYICRDNRTNNNVWIRMNQDIVENINTRLEDLENTSDTAWIIDKPYVHFHAYGVGIGQLYKNKHKYPVYLTNIVLNGNFPSNYNLTFTTSPHKELFVPAIPAGQNFGVFNLRGNNYKRITSAVSSVPNIVKSNNYTVINASNVRTNFSSGNSIKRFKIPPGWYFTLNLENILTWNTRIQGYTEKPGVKYVRDFIINNLNSTFDSSDGLLRENQNNISDFLSYCVETVHDDGSAPRSIKDLFKSVITTWNGQIKHWPE